MQLYPWIVFLHVLGAFGFVLGHGASAMAAFGLRRERSPERIAALLDQSSRSLGMTYASLLLLLLAGIAAGFAGGFWSRGWIWAAIGVLILVVAAMYAMATPYYKRLRTAVGIQSRGSTEVASPEPMPSQYLAELLSSSVPIQLAAIGGIGLAVIIWLMIFKPF